MVKKMAKMLRFWGYPPDRPSHVSDQRRFRDAIHHGANVANANMKKDDAQAIAAEALNFIAGDATRLVRFLDLSGLDPQSIRAVARGSEFLAGVLDYICADEALLIGFADECGRTPAAIERAHRALSATWERDTP
jgi:Protein of unknown function (DUF3572)